MYGELGVFVSSGEESVKTHTRARTHTHTQRGSTDIGCPMICTQFSLFYSTIEYATLNPCTCGREHIQFLKQCICFRRFDNGSNLLLTK